MSRNTTADHIADTIMPSIKPLFGKTKKERIYQALKHGIETGSLPPGSYLPPARTLAKEHNVSITPVYQAIEDLAAESLVETLPGYGTRILEPGQSGASLRRPLVEVFTTLKKVDDRPHMKHLLPAVQEQMIITLRETSGLRIALATLDSTDFSKSMLHFISECRYTKPAVLAFSEPEDFDDEIERHLSHLADMGTAIVYRASRRDCPQFDRVCSAFDQGQYDLTRHLLEQGHTRLIRVATLLDGPYFEKQKQQGFVRAMDQAGFDAAQAEDSTWVLGHQFLNSSPTDRVTFLIGRLTMELKRRPVTAIMAPDDPLVAPFRIALDYMNRSDILVTGYDDIWEDTLGGILYDFGDDLKDRVPPLTVDVQLPMVGDAMATLIVERALKQLPPEPVVRTVPQKLVFHESN